MNDTLDKYYTSNRKRLSEASHLESEEFENMTRMQKFQKQVVEEQRGLKSSNSSQRLASNQSSQKSKPSRFVESSFETSFIFSNAYKPYIKQVPMFLEDEDDEEGEDEDSHSFPMYQRKTGNITNTKPVTAQTARVQQKLATREPAPRSAPIQRPKPNIGLANLALIKSNIENSKKSTNTPPDSNGSKQLPATRVQSGRRMTPGSSTTPNGTIRRPISGVSGRAFSIRQESESESDETDEESDSEEERPPPRIVQKSIPAKSNPAPATQTVRKPTQKVESESSEESEEFEESEEDEYDYSSDEPDSPVAESKPPPSSIKKQTTNSTQKQIPSEEAELKDVPKPDFLEMINQAVRKDDTPENVYLVECERCGRKFNEDSLEKHRKICEKVFFKQRKKMDMRAKMVPKEALQVQKKRSNPDDRKLPMKKIPKWKLQREQFRRAVLGKTEVENFGNTAEFEIPSQEELDGRVACGTCGRKFADIAIERHEKICSTRAQKTVLQSNPKSARKVNSRQR